MQFFLTLTLGEAEGPPVYLRPVALRGGRYHLIVGDTDTTNALAFVGTLEQLATLCSTIAGKVARATIEHAHAQQQGV